MGTTDLSSGLSVSPLAIQSQESVGTITFESLSRRSPRLRPETIRTNEISSPGNHTRSGFKRIFTWFSSFRFEDDFGTLKAWRGFGSTWGWMGWKRKMEVENGKVGAAASEQQLVECREASNWSCDFLLLEANGETRSNFFPSLPSLLLHLLLQLLPSPSSLPLPHLKLVKSQIGGARSNWLWPDVWLILTKTNTALWIVHSTGSNHGWSRFNVV